MRTALKVALATTLGMFCALGFAQEEEETDTFIYATYFYCDVTKQDDVDKIAEEQIAVTYNAGVEDGTIGGWGWLAHQTGGKWRRILYHTSDSIGGLLDAQKKLGAAGAASDPNNEFGQICGAHDDYIWKAETGNIFDGPRGEAGLSAYFICDVAREERADEIVASTLSGIFNDHVGEGQLTSWGWSSHQIGGKYRRLNTMSAANYTDLLAARDSILEAMYGDDGPAEAIEFTEICGGHADYLWDIQIENP